MGDLGIATRYTHDFVRAQIPQGSRDVLEIGCGDGELAAELVKDGLAVTAIDSDEECVAAALSRGVDARHLAWPSDLDRQFDAVLFTRSLHHVSDLNASVTAAQQALRPGGRLMVEDFCAEGASSRSLGWYQGLVRTLWASGAFVDGFDLDERIAAAGPDDDHELHSSDAIEEALHCFSTVERLDAAYFFRYLQGSFRQVRTIEEILRYELTSIELGSIDSFGQRFVASDV